MLARLARQLPIGDGIVYEPKWDGFRCVATVTTGAVDLRSRNGRPFARYFPELVGALAALPESARPFVVDGEILASRDGAADFGALMGRLHPSPSRVARLVDETPACFMAFDVMVVGGQDLCGKPFRKRRQQLERLLARIAAPLFLTPVTPDPAVAETWLAGAGGRAIDGVMVKSIDGHYEPGRRAMVKVKREKTVDCVVGGFRMFADEPGVASLLLGLYAPGGELRHIGVVASFRRDRRRELLVELAPFVVPLEDHPWAGGFALEGGPMGRLAGSAGRWLPAMGLDWVPLRPELVVEVAYDVADGIRFRYPARFRRWRPDRDATSCTIDQLVNVS